MLVSRIPAYVKLNEIKRRDFNQRRQPLITKHTVAFEALAVAYFGSLLIHNVQYVIDGLFKRGDFPHVLD